MFRFSYDCSSAAAPVLSVVTAGGSPVALASPIAPPTVVSPGRYAQDLQSEGDGSFVATVRCGTGTTRIPFTVVAAEFVGLGDSYSSGEGASAYLPAVNACDRAATKTAWEPALAAATHLSFDFAACSGAFLGDFVNPSSAAPGELPQLDHMSSVGRTVLVTLSAGGNDAGFFPVLTSCITGLFAPGRAGCAQRDGAATEQALRSLTSPAAVGCPTPPSGTEATCHPRPSLHGLYETIAARLGHGGTLAVVGYPRLFGPAPGSCVVGRIGALSYSISASDLSWLNAVATQLDEVIAREVEVAAAEVARTRPDVSVRFVSVDAAFDGHRVCDTGTPWLRGLQFAGVFPSTSSFHPNDAGQQHMAGVVVAALVRRSDG